jgi:type IV pilus assembly protein PilO
MSIVDDLRALDTNDPGRWPLPIRIAAIAVVFGAVMAFGIYMFVIEQEMPPLRAAQQEETELRATFEDRQRRAANFDAYRAQLAEIERDFGAMLLHLPGKTEVPSLIVDISQTATGAGLEEACSNRRPRSRRTSRGAADQAALYGQLPRAIIL